MKSLLRLAFVGFIVALLLPGASQAASPKSTITITPFLREIRFNAEEATKYFSVNITNSTSQSQKFNLSVLDFGSLNDSGGIVFAGSNASTLVKKYGLATWLKLSDKELLLGPNETKEVGATINNDSTMTPGGHYAAIIASINSSGGSTNNEVNINQQLTSLILATKVGGEKYDLKLTKMTSNGNLFNLPSKVELTFSNPGNVHVVPRGTVKVVASSGRVVASGPINTESSFVLPETTRKLDVEIERIGSPNIWSAKYHILVDYRYEGIDIFARKDVEIYYLNPATIAIFILFASTIVGIIKLAKIRKSATKNR